MRISPFDIKKIKEIICRHVPGSNVYIFGSRTNNAKKGGDIDLLILDHKRVDFNTKLEILTDLNLEVGEQKYDVVSFSYSEEHPFKSLIMDHAVAI